VANKAKVLAFAPALENIQPVIAKFFVNRTHFFPAAWQVVFVALLNSLTRFCING